MESVLSSLERPLSSIVKRSDRILVKVNMGCSGARTPGQRLTTHPILLEAIVNALLDCGGNVYFGDDISRSARSYESIYERTGMRDVARRTGAMLVDFVRAGGREVRGGLLIPRSYFVTNAYFEADVVINAASCRSHAGIGMSGAIKNMFGCVLGLRKQLIHNLFPGQPSKFGRVIADIYRVIPADLSILDLTTVAEGAGKTLAVRPVGLILAGTDAVALDTVAAHAIGYHSLPIWPTYYGSRFGYGCDAIDQIEVRGIDWDSFNKMRLDYPLITHTQRPSAYDRLGAVINNTVLRPRPAILAEVCTGCGQCLDRCPADCIEGEKDSPHHIRLGQCSDCGVCLKVCEPGAVERKFMGSGRAIRWLLNRLPDQVDPKEESSMDPAPKF